MGFGAALWLLISLLAISFTGNHPGWALGIGGAGGLALGIHLWWQASHRPVSPLISPETGNLAFRMYRYEIFLLGPSLVVLFFANQSPLSLLYLALAWLVLVLIGRRMSTGPFFVTTPLVLPVFLLFIPSLVSLYAAIDLRQSGKTAALWRETRRRGAESP